MKTLARFVVILIGTAGFGSANIGDSDDRVDLLYDGKLVQRQLRDDGTVTMLYHKDRYLCLVVFDRLRSVAEEYSRVDRHELSDREITRLLKANAGGASWQRTDSAEERHYQRSDGKAKATYRQVEGRPVLRVEEVMSKDKAPS